MQAPSHRHNAHPDPAPLHARANRAAIRANDSFEWAHNNLGLLLMNVRLAAAFCLLLLLLLPGCSYLLPAAAPCPPSHRTINPHLPPPPHPRASLFVPAGRCMLAIASLPAAAASLSVAACRCRCCQVRSDYDGAKRFQMCPCRARNSPFQRKALQRTHRLEAAKPALSQHFP